MTRAVFSTDHLMDLVVWTTYKIHSLLELFSIGVASKYFCTMFVDCALFFKNQLNIIILFLIKISVGRFSIDTPTMCHMSQIDH